MPEKGEYVKFKNFERKIKSSFMIYTEFESILVPEIMEIKIKMNLQWILLNKSLTNIKNILLVFMVIN